MDEGLFLLSDVPRGKAVLVFRIMAKRLCALLPYAEIEHVGSTAVPGCIGKGDIDVLVRVLEPDFGAAAAALGSTLARSTRNDATDTYVEYDWQEGTASGSVQLVVAGSFLDGRFRGLKSVLLDDPAAVERYNALKASCAGESMEDYRERKRALIDELLAAAGPNPVTSISRGVHE